MELDNYTKNIRARLQYMVDWADKQGHLEDHCFTFPDGDTFWATGHEPKPPENE